MLISEVTQNKQHAAALTVRPWQWVVCIDPWVICSDPRPVEQLIHDHHDQIHWTFREDIVQPSFHCKHLVWSCLYQKQSAPTPSVCISFASFNFNSDETQVPESGICSTSYRLIGQESTHYQGLWLSGEWVKSPNPRPIRIWGPSFSCGCTILMVLNSFAFAQNHVVNVVHIFIHITDTD